MRGEGKRGICCSLVLRIFPASSALSLQQKSGPEIGPASVQVQKIPKRVRGQKANCCRQDSMILDLTNQDWTNPDLANLDS